MKKNERVPWCSSGLGGKKRGVSLKMMEGGRIRPLRPLGEKKKRKEEIASSDEAISKMDPARG